MTLEEMIQVLRRETGLESLHLDENQICRLVFEERESIDIELLPDQKTIFLHSILTKVPSDNRESLYAKALEANLFFQKTGDASIGLDPALEELLLFQKVLLEKSGPEEFLETLSSFLTTLKNWQKPSAEPTFEQDSPVSWIQG